MTMPSKVNRFMRGRIPVLGRHIRQIRPDWRTLTRTGNVMASGEGPMGSLYIPAWWHAPRSPVRKSEEVPESAQTTEDAGPRLKKLEEKVQTAIDIGLENRKLLEQLLLEDESRIGLGAIHSLDQGRVQLSHPLIYNYQVLDDEVVAGIEEMGVYGVGATESEAVRELQEELWNLVQELERTLPEELSAHLKKTLKTLTARM